MYLRIRLSTMKNWKEFLRNLRTFFPSSSSSTTYFKNFSFFRDSDSPRLSFGHAGKLLTVPFVPERLCMEPETGRVYHPGPSKTGGIGLVSDKLNIQWTTVSSAISKLMREASDLPSGKYHWFAIHALTKNCFWSGEKVRLWGGRG